MRCARLAIVPLVTLLAATFAPAGLAIDDDALLVPEIIGKPFTGDLSEIRERGILRALVSPSRTDFFIRGGRPQGLQVEALNTYLKDLNKGLKRRDLHVAVKYVIVPFKDLIPALLEGRGDLITANLTVTPEREARVAFVKGRNRNIDELVVTHKDVSGISSVDDLGGRTVHVLAGSSYASHLREINARLEDAGKATVEVVETDPVLTSEDLLEMVNAGVYEITVVDDYKALLWAKQLEHIVVHEEVKVHEGGTLGWAMRKDNPELLASLEATAPKLRAGSLIGNTLIKRYYGSTKWIGNPLAKADRERLERLVALFKKYGEQYGFDWLALAAQGYQESRLEQSTKSHAGAVGIMQVLPSTAKGRNINIPDISTEENNIHAGTKFMAFLRDRYFDDPALAEEDQVAFAWAAYNAGPGNVRKMRRKAEAMGLDPNRWFGHVEQAALIVIGQETTNYVRNIYKYYIAYKTLAAANERRRELKKSVQ